jgi:Ala-tRNA(Pro) deacylase
MNTPTWIRKMLTYRGLRYEELHHADTYTAQELAEAEHFSGHHVAKVVVVMVEGRPVELVLPASRKVSLERVRRVLNTRDVRFASEEEMEKCFTDVELGAIPPLRHWKNVPVIMDRALNAEGDILFQAGTHHDAVRLNFQDWYELVRPQVAGISMPEFAHA